jgi:hypothetical protein
MGPAGSSPLSQMTAIILPGFVKNQNRVRCLVPEQEILLLT